MVEQLAVKKNRTKEEVTKDLEEVEDFSLVDVEGIGNIRLKKLNLAGIERAEDLIVRGPMELHQLTGLDFDACADMIEKARESLQKKDIIGKTSLSGRELLDHRAKKIQYLTTGAKNFDEIMGGGMETGVMTEVYGEFGSGKTQIAMTCAVNVFLPTKDGGFSDDGKLARVVYIDTENSFRPDRMLQIIYERGMVKTKEQTPAQLKANTPKEPLNEEEQEKALRFLDRVKIYKPDNAGQQVMVGEALGRELRDENADPIRLIIIDSITSAFRMDFSGRGELGERQQLIKKHIKHVSRIAEIYNVAVLLTNQVMVSPSVMFGDPVKPIGGTTLGHTSTHRVYLRKSGKDKIVAKLVDSPNNAQNEAVLSLTRAGVVNGE